MSWSCGLVTSSHLPFSLVQGWGSGAVPRFQAKQRGAKVFEPDTDAPVLAGELGRARPRPWPSGTGGGERTIKLVAL